MSLESESDIILVPSLSIRLNFREAPDPSRELSIVDEVDAGPRQIWELDSVEAPDGHTMAPHALLAGRTNAAALDSTAIFSLRLLRLIFLDLQVDGGHDVAQNLRWLPREWTLSPQTSSTPLFDDTHI